MRSRQQPLSVQIEAKFVTSAICTQTFIIRGAVTLELQIKFIATGLTESNF